jgi:hypothetical protein
MNNHYTISLLMFVSHLALGLDIGNLCWIRYVASTIHWYINIGAPRQFSFLDIAAKCMLYLGIKR